MSLPPPLELSLLEPDQECQMLPVIEQLRDYSNFSRWLDQVQEALAEWDLQDYIDPFAPRPEPDDSGYEEWKQQADVIFSWLCLYTSPALREDPIFKRSPPQLPEEYIPTVKDIHLVNIDEFFDPPYSKYGETIYSVGLADECPKYMAEETFEMMTHRGRHIRLD
ncbi:uncharacterized protein BP01DRAFT_422934 [Aspergillus saccharolyticus JOP 1030-1]|uniref:Uncharacterized protein n=1 Tax=Aspergillus saccharolyticus JOP 1030-1 TaxID=1450539 RepID=A0A318ZGK4_9EURO|nr:hypothetical protein BP01DRAFT_422934 [Aspergillus saccharolyticus JOP 1030-1]PYH45877.1 hypothetical protein BP01DRAFT_422934 [Aspergillus saccharolyticus JOP 1030-1]